MAELNEENRLEEQIEKKVRTELAKQAKNVTYPAEVIRSDSEGTWWVRLPGNTTDTPIIQSKIDMSVGDIISVTIDNDKHITIADTNESNPPWSGNKVQYVMQKAEETTAPAVVLANELAQNGVTSESITRQYGYFEQLEARNITAQVLSANKAYIDDLEANNITAQTLAADHATIDNLDATYATIDNLEAESARITTLEADNVTVNQKITAAEGRIGTLESDNVTVNQKITAAEGDIATLKSNKADISYLESDYIKADVIAANYAQANLANVNNAWIENGTIKDAAIVDAQILGVSANKLTAGTIDASKINVANLRAKNLVVEKLNGQPVLGGYELVNSNMSGYSSKNPASEGWYEYSNGEWTASIDTAVVESKVYYKDADQVELYDQTYIDGLEDTLNQRIDGAVETFTGSVVPTMVNYPVSDWTSSQYASHVGDIYYVVNQSSDENGYCYRFAYDNTTHSYQWVLIKDSDVTKALSDISDLQAFESETSSWIDETDEGLRTIRTNHTALSGVVDKTVKSSVQLWFTKANTTAPSAPTSKVETNNVSTANAWNLAVPTYNASYPNYYYCWQYQYADNTYGWSAVVRDVAMGETQSTARSAQTTASAALPASTFTNFQQTTFKELVDEVDEQSSTISTLSSRVDQKADGSTVTTLSNTVNTVKQTADTNKTSITNLTTTTQTLRTDLDNLEVGGRNLVLSSKDLSKCTPAETYFVKEQTGLNGSTAIRYKGTNTETSRVFANISVMRNVTIPAVLAEDTAFTVSCYVKKETPGASSSSVFIRFTRADGEAYPGLGGQAYKDVGVPIPYGPTNGWIRISNSTDILAGEYSNITYTIGANGSSEFSLCLFKFEKGNKATDWSPAPEDVEASIAEVRTTTTNKFNEVTETLDGVTRDIGVIQNDLTSKADGTTVTTLTTKVNNISDTVDGHTQTITQVTTTANYAKDAFDNMEIGGRNLLKGRNLDTEWTTNGLTFEYNSATWECHIYGTNTKTDAVWSLGSYNADALLTDELVPGEDYTLTAYGNILDANIYAQLNTYVSSGSQVGDWSVGLRNNRTSHTVPCRNTYASHDLYGNLFIGVNPDVRAIDVTFKMKFEKGNVSTDWSPAPEDIRRDLAETKTDYATFKQTVNQFQSTIGSTYATKTIGNENLTPMFSSHNADGTYPDGDANGYWQSSQDKTYNRSCFTALEDGWVHLEACNSAQKEFVPPYDSSLKEGDKVTMLVEYRNVSYTGSGANFYTRNYPNNVQLPANWSFITTQTEDGEIRHVYTVSAATGNYAWNGLVNITFTAKSSSTWTGDIRISFYRGDYQGPYKPYVGSKLYSSKSEIKQTADSINLEVSKKVGANEIISKINQSPEEITIDADRIKINGTTIFSSNGTNTTLDNYLGSNYVSGQDVTTATDFNTFTSSGVYYIKNGSCANAPTTNWGKLDVSVSGKTVQLFYPDALSYYYYRAKTGSTWSAWTKVDGVGAAATVQTNLDNLEVGGSNLLKGSMTLAVSETGKCGWMPNSQTPEIVTKDGYRCLHSSASLSQAWTPSIRTRNRVLLEWGQEYRYSGYIMYDKAIKTASTVPLYYHAGSVETLDEFNLSIINKGGGVSIIQIEPGANVTVPANTWQRYVYKIQTAASAPNASYPYPTIAPFIYGSVRTVSETATVNMWARDLQIEKGSKVTSWRQASEDAESYADAAVESIPLHHNLATNYSYTASQLAGYAEEGHTTWWEITGSTTENVRIGDTVSLKITNSTTGKDAYLNGEVTQVNSSTRITVKAHGLSDTGASILAENATAVVNVYPTAIDFVKGTATLAVSLCVGGAAKTPTSYKWTKGTDYTTSLGTGSTLAVTDLDAVYNCECTWS